MKLCKFKDHFLSLFICFWVIIMSGCNGNSSTEFNDNNRTMSKADLTKASDGDFYDTSNFRTKFRINLATWLESVTYRFRDWSCEGNLQVGLTQTPNDNLYVTTENGGNHDMGAIFKITPSGDSGSLIYKFTGNFDGEKPNPDLIKISDGYLYGTTILGGYNNFGTIFKINPATGLESVIYSFRGWGDGGNPQAGLIQASDGNLYVTTENGGNSGRGAIFKINPAKSSVSLIYSFTGNFDGANPKARLMQASDGDLYGTTYYGGTHNAGTVFRINPATGLESVVYSFSLNDGANPKSQLTQASDGDFYGTTYYGGIHNAGTVFRINLATGLESVVYSFMGGVDGIYPATGLIQASDGNLYGTTSFGGYNNFGTVFRINSSTGLESVIYRFRGWGDGGHPKSNLIKALDDKLYVVTEGSSKTRWIAVLRINPITNSSSLVYIPRRKFLTRIISKYICISLFQHTFIHIEK